MTVIHLSQDEIGKLGQAFNIMTENLRKLVSQVTDSVKQVAAVSAVLTEGAENQLRRQVRSQDRSYKLPKGHKSSPKR